MTRALMESPFSATASMLFIHALPAFVADEFASTLATLHDSVALVPLGDGHHEEVVRYNLTRLLLDLEVWLGSD